MVMSDHEDACTLLSGDSTKKSTERMASSGINIGKWLIKEEEGWPRRKGACQGNPLLLAS